MDGTTDFALLYRRLIAAYVLTPELSARQLASILRLLCAARDAPTTELHASSQPAGGPTV